MFKYIAQALGNIKRNLEDPYIIIGGDTNRLRLNEVTDRFGDIEIMNIGGTRGQAELDKLATYCLYDPPTA